MHICTDWPCTVMHHCWLMLFFSVSSSVLLSVLDVQDAIKIPLCLLVCLFLFCFCFFPAGTPERTAVWSSSLVPCHLQNSHLCFVLCVLSGLALACLALPCPALPCPALPCPGLHVLVCMPCPAMPLPCPCLALPSLLFSANSNKKTTICHHL